MNWDWIWEHWDELTPQERRIVSETIHVEMRRAFAAYAEACERAARSVKAFGNAIRALREADPS